jgi:hypothetical protein
VESWERAWDYDPNRDYQTGQARASAGDQGGNEDRIELPAVISAGVAKSLTEQVLMRRWAKRDKLTLRLPPRNVAIEPGTVVATPLSPSLWSVERCTVDGFVAVAELRPWCNGSAVIAAEAPVIAAEAGRVARSSDLAPSDVTLALFEVPDVGSQATDNLTLSVAASSDTAGWKPCTIQVETAQGTTSVRSASRKTALGELVTPLGAGQPYLIDSENSFDVQLIDVDQWLMSCDDEALVNGANLAMAGNELLQFADVTPISPGRFRLERLLRGRGGTEWAAQAHTVGDTFALLDANALRVLQLPASALGSTVTASTTSAPGQISSLVSAQLSGEALRPPSPVGLKTSVSASGDLKVSWVRRSRAGWFWIDNVDAPLGESREAYRVSIVGPSDTFDVECDTSSFLIPRAALLPTGLGPATVQVRQIGDWNVSHAAEAAVTLT